MLNPDSPDTGCRSAAWLVRLYQLTLTRWTRPCPEAECCSDYALRILRQHGLRQALELIALRLENCGKDLSNAALDYDHYPSPDEGGRPLGLISEGQAAGRAFNSSRRQTRNRS